jgi:hypothetical protein
VDFLSRKDPITIAVEEAVKAEKSPSVEGFVQGTKAALMAAPVGAAIQALRDKNPKMGALIAGLGVGALAGISAAAVQKYNNTKTEAELRYHMRNMINREPTVALPSPIEMAQVNGFVRGFGNVHYPY